MCNCASDYICACENRMDQMLVFAILCTNFHTSIKLNDLHLMYGIDLHCRNDLCMLAFKIIHDRRHGPLTFVRVYSGCLVQGTSLYNVGRDCTERPVKIYQMNADEHKEVSRVTAGNIAAVSGLKQVE